MTSIRTSRGGVEIPSEETALLPSTHPADPVLTEARQIMIERGGQTITRADVRRAELLTGQHLEIH